MKRKKGKAGKGGRVTCVFASFSCMADMGHGKCINNNNDIIICRVGTHKVGTNCLGKKTKSHACQHTCLAVPLE